MTFPQQLRATSPEGTAASLHRLMPAVPVRTFEDWLAERRTPPPWAQALVLAHLSKLNLGASGHAKP